MRLTSLIYGTMVATAFMGGTAIYYLSTPRPTIRAVDLVEIVEGTLERSAAIAPWPIGGGTNAGVGWGNYTATNSGASWSFNPYPDTPVVGAVASRDLLVRTLSQIETLPGSFVRSYTDDSVEMWTATGLWTQCQIADGVYPNWTIAVSNGIPIYGVASDLSYGAQTAVLFEAYRLLCAMTCSVATASTKETAIYGVESESINPGWYVDGIINSEPLYDNTFLPELEWIYGVESNADALAALRFSIVDYRSEYTALGLPHYNLYYWPLTEYHEWVDVVSLGGMSANATFHNPNQWTYSAGLPGLHENAVVVSGYCYVAVADFPSGVLAHVSLSVATTGSVRYTIGYSTIGSNSFGTAIQTFDWTEACRGSITGLCVSLVTNYHPDSLLDSAQIPIEVVGGLHRTGADGPSPGYGNATYSYLTMLMGQTRYFFPRPAIISWSFIYCK